MGEPVLEITGLRKRYGELTALDGVSLTVERGEVFGLLGPNGAGKTTLLSIAAGLTCADEGAVTLFGKPFARVPRKSGRLAALLSIAASLLGADEGAVTVPGARLARDTRGLRHLVGIGTQELAIYPDLTARENLRFFGKLYGLSGTRLGSRVGAVLEAVGLTDRANHRAGTFSGGMKRRLNLAVAVVHEPKLLFLDEPTTGVDPQSRNHIFEQVKALNAAGLTVIYTSHYMEEVQALCNRIAILDAGRLRASDTLSNLLKSLDSTVRITVTGAPGDFARVLGAIPGVKRVAEEPLPPAPSPEKGGGAKAPSPAGRGRLPATPSEPDSRTEAAAHLLPLPARRPARSSADRAGEHEGRGPGGGLPSTFALVVEEIGPVLARIASECAARGVALVSAATTEPTLERVFLNLTGRGLRD